MIAPTVKDDMGAVIEEYAEPIEPVEFKRLLSIYRENVGFSRVPLKLSRRRRMGYLSPNCGSYFRITVQPAG